MLEKEVRVLNRSVMEELIGDDPAMMMKFEQKFLQQAQATFVRLVDLFKKKDLQQIKEEAHFLKTSAKAIGAERVSTILEKLEYASLESDYPACKGLIVSTANELKQLNMELKHVYEQN